MHGSMNVKYSGTFTPRRLVYHIRRFKGLWCLHLQSQVAKKTGLLHPEDDDIAILPNVVIYHQARRNIAKHSNIHIHYLWGGGVTAT